MIKTALSIRAPRRQVFAVLTDYPRYTEWLPGCEQCRIVSIKGLSVDIEIALNSFKSRLGMRFDAEPVQAIGFRTTSSKDLKTYAGSYRLMDSADGKETVVFAEWELQLRSALPGFIVDHAAKKSLEQLASALKKYIESLPTPAEAAAQAPARSQARRGVRRPKRILEVVKTSTGYRVWLLGNVLTAKK